MSKKSLLLVVAQCILLGYLFFTGLKIYATWITAIQMSGVLVALWGIATMRLGNFNIQPEVKSNELVQNGPYRWIRNPMYLGILLLFVPSVLANYTLLRLIALLLLILVLFLKIVREEQFLEASFGEDYSQYKARTKRLLPFII